MIVDYKLLVEQDQQFADFLKEAYFQVAKSNTETLKVFYSFFQMGLTVDQCVTFIVNQMRSE